MTYEELCRMEQSQLIKLIDEGKLVQAVRCKGDTHCLPYIAVNNETYGTSDLFDINYCPMCGRKLNNAPTDNI